MTKKGSQELTNNLMENGYLLKIDFNYWTGRIQAYPGDLCPGKAAVPFGHPKIQVMPESWIKKQALITHSVEHGDAYRLSQVVFFEGRKYRYVLKGAAPLVFESLERANIKIQNYLREAYTDYKGLRNRGRIALSRNMKYLWKTVSQYHPTYHSFTGEPPEDWTAQTLDNLMNNRFPTEENLRKMGLFYTVFRPEKLNLDFGGSQYYEFPGPTVNATNVSRFVMSFHKKIIPRLNTRIQHMTDNKFDQHFGVLVLCLKHLEQDLRAVEAYNPVKVPGYDVEAKIAHIRDYTSKILPIDFSHRREIRMEVAERVLDLLRVLNGPWKDQRKNIYLKTFGPV